MNFDINVRQKNTHIIGNTQVDDSTFRDVVKQVAKILKITKTIFSEWSIFELFYFKQRCEEDIQPSTSVFLLSSLVEKHILPTGMILVNENKNIIQTGKNRNNKTKMTTETKSWTW